jgi:O-antigen/teichoic acid export membrane protein
MPVAPAEAPFEDSLSGPDVARQVVLGGVQRTAGFVVVNLLTLAAAVLLLRHLGVREFGRYGTVMALLTIVQGVSDAGLTLTGARELAVATTQEQRRELLSHLIGLRIVLSAVGVLLAIIFAWAVGYPRVMVEGTAIAGAGVFVISVQGAIVLPLTTELRNWRLAVNDMLRQAALVACFVVLVLAGAGLLPFLAAQLAAALVVLTITPLLATQRHLVLPRWNRAELRLLAGRTLPLAISGALVVVYFRVLVIMISLLEPSARQIGFFVTSERVIEVFLGLPAMLVGVALPVLSVSARDNAGRLSYVTLRMTQTMAAIGMLFAVVVATGARPIIMILGGAQYAAAAPVLRIQCFALITVFITQAWTTTLVGMGRARALAAGTAIGVSAVLAIGVALILPFGAIGGAIAAVAADVVYCAAILWFVHRAGAAGGLTAGPFLRIAAAAVPAFALAVLSPLPELINCLLATLLYLVLTLGFGALPPEISERVLALVRRGGSAATR